MSNTCASRITHFVTRYDPSNNHIHMRKKIQSIRHGEHNPRVSKIGVLMLF